MGRFLVLEEKAARRALAFSAVFFTDP